MRAGMSRLATTVGVVAIGVCACNTCPTPKCNNIPIDVLGECAVALHSCSIDGHVYASCTPGTGDCGALYHLAPGSVVDIPIGPVWENAGTRSDLDIYFGHGGAVAPGDADFSTATVLLDGKPAPDTGSERCERYHDEVKCYGVRGVQDVQFSYASPNEVVSYDVDIVDFACDAPVCQV